MEAEDLDSFSWITESSTANEPKPTRLVRIGVQYDDRKNPKKPQHKEFKAGKKAKSFEKNVTFDWIKVDDVEDLEKSVLRDLQRVILDKRVKARVYN